MQVCSFADGGDGAHASSEHVCVLVVSEDSRSVHR